MFDHNHYVPILKGREGEYGALRTLTEPARAALTPLLEIPPILWDFEEERPAKTVDEHLKKVGQKIESAWGRGRRLFVDLVWIPEAERMNGGEHPLQFVFRSLRAREVEAIPVIGLVRSPEYLQACRDIVIRDQRGVCLRVQREDFADYEDLGAAVGRILDLTEATPQDADLVLDLRALTIGDPLTPDALVGLVNRLPWLRRWRTFTVSATSFPRTLMGIPPSDCSWVPRYEWTLWTDTIRARKRLVRVPTFGDYGISHPEPSEVDPRIMRPSASIRYTCETAWLVLKARNLRDYGYEQFHQVCRDLIQRAEYAGRRFSWGDEYIDDCAAERVGTGNLTTWRKVGTSHHLTFVVRQLATEVDS